MAQLVKNVFKRGKKTPPELVKSTHNNIKTMAEKKSDEKTMKKAMEKISNNLSNMKFMLYGDGDSDPKPDIIKKLGDELFSSNLLLELLDNIKQFEFEARKDVAQIYNFILRQRKKEALDYVKAHQEILKTLVQGYSDPEIALNCGSIFYGKLSGTNNWMSFFLILPCLIPFSNMYNYQLSMSRPMPLPLSR